MKPQQPVVSSASSAPMPRLAFSSDGSVISNSASEALAAGIGVGAIVKVVMGAELEAEQERYIDKVGKVQNMAADGCTVCFDGETSDTCVKFATSSLHLLTKDEQTTHKKASLQSKKDKDAEPDVVLPKGIGYDLASKNQTNRTMMNFASACLWKLVVSSGTGADGLVLVESPYDEGKMVVAGRKFMPYQVFVVPYGDVVARLQCFMRFIVLVRSICTMAYVCTSERSCHVGVTSDGVFGHDNNM